MLSFERTKQPQQLHDAISAMQKVVEMTTDDHPYRYSFHITLSIAFGHRYEISHNIDDLDASIHASKSALELIPEDNIAAHAHIFGNLCNAYRQRYGRLNEPSDIEEAISTGELAIALIPDENPLEKASGLGNLCNAHIERFEGLGDINDIERAIELGLQAMGLLPDGHP